MTAKVGIIFIRLVMSTLWVIDSLTFFGILTRIKIQKRYGYAVLSLAVLIFGVFFGTRIIGSVKSMVIGNESALGIISGDLSSGDTDSGQVADEKENNEQDPGLQGQVAGISVFGDLANGDEIGQDPDFPELGITDLEDIESDSEPEEIDKFDLKTQLSAKSVLAVDLDTEEVLFEKNRDLILPPASTSKLMTAIVSLEKYSLDDVLEVSYECANLNTSKAWFPAGSRYTVKDLIFSTLVYSAGDAACTLASGLTVTDGKATYDEKFSNQFVYDMNQKAKDLGLEHTFYTNAVGLDGVASSHYSTTGDLYLLTKEALSKELIRDAVKTKTYEVSSVDGEYSYKAENTNKLLWEVEGTVGVKTGTTVAAGEVLIYQYSKEGRNILIIVMGSNSRFEDTKKILDMVLVQD